jgi:hypothetical protein
MTTEQGYKTSFDAGTTTSDLNAQAYLISRMLTMVRTNMLVQVVAVNDPGGASLTGTVDVMPLVNQLDGYMTGISHKTIYGLTYFRVQGGANAIIITPQVGDQGMAAICDRDSSAVVKSRKKSNPGSLRMHSMSDGIYFGGMLNAVPLRYVMIQDTGITIEGAMAVTIHGTHVVVNSENSVVVNAPSVSVPLGDVVASGVSLVNHVHIDPGEGFTGGPIG